MVGRFADDCRADDLVFAWLAVGGVADACLVVACLVAGCLVVGRPVVGCVASGCPATGRRAADEASDRCLLRAAAAGCPAFVVLVTVRL
ncbi:hypothetical protein C3488_12905 [Streptomyces sp. Ru72]|nr:hypothetical protein C3488_12905 [Streptomyces sp. Ru72]